MAFAGLKKQMNKTQQYLSEKIGGKEGSKVDDEFIELERQVDATAKCMENLNNKVMEFLQPNPVTRAKLASLATYSKVRGTNSDMQYPQVERQLGELLVRNAEEIGSQSCYAKAVNELGDGFMRLADIKDSLDCDIKQNFIDPTDQSIKGDYKDNILAHRKKMNSRRLDYDYKISQHEKGKVTNDELYIAEDKFNESLQSADVGMKRFVQNEEEHIHQLMAFVGFLKDYHQSSLSILDEVHSNLQSAAHEAASRPKPDDRPIARVSSVQQRTNNISISGPSDMKPMSPQSGGPPPGPPPPKPASLSSKTPSAKVLFDFDAENATELDLKENDIVILTKKIDENWFEGEINGRKGYFPVNYVEVINPL